MDSESRLALRVLEAIALSHERLIDLSVKLRFRPEVLEVLQNVSLRKYQSRPTVEGYVDAKLHCARSVCWWLEAYCDGNQWVIESRVSTSNLVVDEGSEDLIRFPDAVAETLDEFLTRLEEVTSQLVDSTHSINLSTCQLHQGSNST